MRKAGWLSAQPDPQWSKRKTRKTRREKLGDSTTAQMPKLEHGSHLVEWLFEIGPVESGANGAEPLSWQEINAWKQATGTAATTEELLMIRNLSLEYVNQMRQGENPQAKNPAPVGGGDKAGLDNQIKSVLRRQAKRDKPA